MCGYYQYFVIKNRNTILINSEHLQEIKQKYPDGDHDRLHRKNFRSWFHKKVALNFEQ